MWGNTPTVERRKRGERTMMWIVAILLTCWVGMFYWWVADDTRKLFNELRKEDEAESEASAR